MTHPPAAPTDAAAPQPDDEQTLARRANAARLALYLAPSPYRLRVARQRERELVAWQTAEGRAAPYVRGVVVRWREGGGG
jgi:hypothetical protein